MYLRFAICLALAAAAPSAWGDGWENTVGVFRPGVFPELRPVSVKYNFGWNGIAAAKCDVRFTTASNGNLQFDATGGTIGLVQRLWNYEIKHTALSDAQTLLPIEVNEVENVRSKRMTTDLLFTPLGVTSEREERKGASVKSKTRKFEFPNVLSVNSALLYLRTQPLPKGAVQRIVVYPSTSAYLCTVRGLGRERIIVSAGSYEALKLDIQLKKIGKKRELMPHKKFRQATVWLSDDADRLPLKIEAKVFIGSVFAELQSVRYADARP